MKTFQLVASEPNSPATTPSLPDTAVGNTILFSIVAPLIFFAAQKGWEWVQSRIKRDEKRENSELASVERIVAQSVQNKDQLLSQLQEQYNKLLSDVVDKNDAALANLEAIMRTVLQVQATQAENLKHYGELAAQSDLRLQATLDRIDSITARQVGEAFSTQARLYADLRQNQALMSEKLTALHCRFDKHFGADQG